MKTIDLQIGSDPELFIRDNERGMIVSSLNVLGHRTKHEPIDLGDGMKTYADNALMEVSFPPVCANEGPEPFVAQLKTAMERMQLTLGGRYSLATQASHVFDKEELQDPLAWEAGCNPNHDVYTEQLNMPADFKACGCLRTGSFHIHLGNNKYGEEEDGMLLTYKQRLAAIKLLDIYLGCPSVIFDHDKTGPERRRLYGRAGEFRPTPYGVEYRVLGNWSLAKPETIELVYLLATHAVRRLESPDYFDILAEMNPHMIQECINTNNLDQARWVMENSELPSRLVALVEGIKP